MSKSKNAASEAGTIALQSEHGFRLREHNVRALRLRPLATASLRNEVPEEYPGILLRLTIHRGGCKLNAMRAKATTAFLLAWILAGSGICQCLASVPDKLLSQSHDCSSEPAAPTGQTDEPCESGCAAADAVEARAETQAIRDFANGIDVAPSSAMTWQLRESAGWRIALSIPDPASSSPPYILHSALLL